MNAHVRYDKIMCCFDDKIEQLMNDHINKKKIMVIYFETLNFLFG